MSTIPSGRSIALRAASRRDEAAAAFESRVDSGEKEDCARSIGQASRAETPRHGTDGLAVRRRRGPGSADAAGARHVAQCVQTRVVRGGPHDSTRDLPLGGWRHRRPILAARPLADLGLRPGALDGVPRGLNCDGSFELRRALGLRRPLRHLRRPLHAVYHRPDTRDRPRRPVAGNERGAPLVEPADGQHDRSGRRRCHRRGQYVLGDRRRLRHVPRLRDRVVLDETDADAEPHPG